MQHGNETAPSASAASFAGLLASLTAPKQPAKWSDDGLADDIATLNYENALRAHARYRTPDRTDRSLTQAAPADSDRIDSYELAPVDEVTEELTAASSAVSRANADNRQPAGAKDHTDFEALAARLKSCPVTKQVGARSASVDSRPVSKQVSEWSTTAVSRPVTRQNSSAAHDAVRRVPTLFERNFKTASITIRMSREECDQLHTRAAEAGLTVSAYLRSCTFEAESLRALVKDTMAQLQAATAAQKQPTPTRPSLGRRLIRFFTFWHA
jgi:predicted DNA binding CopG/RHH family protein